MVSLTQSGERYVKRFLSHHLDKIRVWLALLLLSGILTIKRDGYGGVSSVQVDMKRLNRIVRGRRSSVE